MCNGNATPYLNAGSNPATGLLIDKIQKLQPALRRPDAALVGASR